MATSSDFSIGLIHEFVITAAKAGLNPVDLTKLAQSEQKCHEVLLYLRGASEIRPIKFLVDLNAEPYCLDGFSVVRHDRGGLLRLVPAEVELYLTEEQRGGKDLCGHAWLEKLRQLKNKILLNANALDAWLANPHCIPEKWKGKYIFFPGTEYCGPDGRLIVRYLCWNCDQWGGGWSLLDGAWGARSFAALLASPLRTVSP